MLIRDFDGGVLLLLALSYTRQIIRSPNRFYLSLYASNIYLMRVTNKKSNFKMNAFVISFFYISFSSSTSSPCSSSYVFFVFLCGVCGRVLFRYSCIVCMLHNRRQ